MKNFTTRRCSHSWQQIQTFSRVWYFFPSREYGPSNRLIRPATVSFSSKSFPHLGQGATCSKRNSARSSGLGAVFFFGMVRSWGLGVIFAGNEPGFSFGVDPGVQSGFMPVATDKIFHFEAIPAISAVFFCT